MRRPQRICHLLHHLALGGLETQVLRIIEATPDESASFTVCYLDEDDSLRAEFEEAGTSVVRLDTGAESLVGQFSPGAVRNAVEFLREEEFDAVHVHGSLYLFTFARVCARLAGVPVVGTYHTPRPSFHPATRVAERVTRPLSAVDIAVSEDVEHSYAGSAEHYEPESDGLSRSTYTVHNGIAVPSFREDVANADPDRLRREYELEDGLVFLNVGRYTERKNQKPLVEAMARLVDQLPESHLFLVGWGPLEDELCETAAEYGVADHVSVTGRSRSVEDYYALADAFVLPSLTEGLSVVLLEAMAAGLPVVGTDAPGTAEVVVDGETGLVTDTATPDALAEAMLELTADSRREYLGDNGLSRVRAEFSAESTARSYLDVYRSLD